MLGEVQFYPPRGIYKIVEITNRDGSNVTDEVINRIGRHIVFPFDIEKGMRINAFYVNYNCISPMGGKMLMTTEVESIQIKEDVSQIQVSTRNSQYVFERVQ